MIIHLTTKGRKPLCVNIVLSDASAHYRWDRTSNITVLLFYIVWFLFPCSYYFRSYLTFMFLLLVILVLLCLGFTYSWSYYYWSHLFLFLLRLGLLHLLCFDLQFGFYYAWSFNLCPYYAFALRFGFIMLGLTY